MSPPRCCTSRRPPTAARCCSAPAPRDGVAAFDPVVAPEGLIGVVLNVSDRTSMVMTWAHPEFRVSAFTVTGNAAGVVAPSARRRRRRSSSAACPTATRCRSARWCSPRGSAACIPRAFPVGTVTGVVREQAGWERVYRLLPAANPGSAAHVLVLVTPQRRPRARVPERLRARGAAARFARPDPGRRLRGAGRP